MKRAVGAWARRGRHRCCSRHVWPSRIPNFADGVSSADDFVGEIRLPLSGSDHAHTVRGDDATSELSYIRTGASRTIEHSHRPRWVALTDRSGVVSGGEVLVLVEALPLGAVASGLTPSATLPELKPAPEALPLLKPAREPASLTCAVLGVRGLRVPPSQRLHALLGPQRPFVELDIGRRHGKGQLGLGGQVIVRCS